MEKLPPKVIEWLKKYALTFPNVIGFSLEFEPKIIAGTATSELSVRFYVSRKVDLKYLERPIPRELVIRSGLFKKLKFITDVVAVEQPIALVDKTARFRPVELGVSVGNAKITAGSLGNLYKHNEDIVAGSNAHVLTPDAGMSVEVVIESGNVDILQPGAAHGGTEEDIVGKYLWHQQIVPIGIPSECPFATGISTILNVIAWLFKRETRLIALRIGTNTIDFAMYKPTTEHTFKVADDSIIPAESQFIGHLFAGSSNSGIICKISEIQKACPVVPYNGTWADVAVGDTVRGCSFWCNYETEVLDASAVITVNYGRFNALFENVILVKNENVIKGGWSGSGWFKK